MVLRTFCDRCDKDVFKDHTIRAQIVGGTDGMLVWSLCEECALIMRKWIEEEQHARD